MALARGGKGAVAPNVGKDGPCNSSIFDEKIGGGVGIHLRCEKIINTKYFECDSSFLYSLFIMGLLFRAPQSTFHHFEIINSIIIIIITFYCKNERNKLFSKSQFGHSAKSRFILIFMCCEKPCIRISAFIISYHNIISQPVKGALVRFIAKVEGVDKEKFSGAEPQTPTFPHPR